MLDRHRPTSGRDAWDPPSPWDLLLGSLSRIERTQAEQFRMTAEQNSRLGGLETGQRITLEAVEASFDLHRETDRRLTTVEAQQAARSSTEAEPSRSKMERLTAFLAALLPVLPSLLSLAMLAVVAALAVKGAIEPEQAIRWLGLARGSD